MKNIKVLDLAEYIIDKSEKDNKPISNLQLQKILYYIQVAFIKKYKEPLFLEDIEAWQFGPVVPEVYNHYCGFGSLDISIEYNISLDIEEKDKIMLDQIVEEKRELRPWSLVEDTHAPSKAWSQVYQNGWGNRNRIPVALMLAHG